MGKNNVFSYVLIAVRTDMFAVFWFKSAERWLSE